MGGLPIFFKLSATPLPGSNDECNFTVLTTLASPNPEFIGLVKAGDSLTVVSNETTRGLEVASQQGNICGNIIASVSRINNCIKKGISFEAKVITRNGAECQVLIQKSTHE